MNITNDLLIKLTKDFVAKRVRQNKDVVAIYLTGSVLSGNPLLGGTTDIDLASEIDKQIALRLAK